MTHSLYYPYNPFSKESLSGLTSSVGTGAVEDNTFSHLKSQKALCPKDQSLASVFPPRRSSLKDLSATFVRDAKHRRACAFPLTINDDDQGATEPPRKRRRFERRNSKTAAMLFSSMSSINPADFLDDERSEDAMEDPWDGGLEIAEDLVRQLKLRRMSKSVEST